jgi:valyl-tRNA synthetase
MEKAYSPQEVENRLYNKWLNDQWFSGKIDQNKESYSIVIPPPNVTGVLTMGHVLNNTIQDILARRARQEGKSVLWLPGTDHAGIATQTKVEQALRKEGKDRRSMGRKKFLEHAAEWRDKHGGIIFNQLQKLGCSCDWERNVHTLDEAYSKAVIDAFVKLYDRGYVYRGKRMVNWCPVSLTALSDEEVIMKPQISKLYKIRYEIIECPGDYLHVSTTRPETIMGDVALAIHPEDERWTELEGKSVRRPLQTAEIPIIADSAVEKDFGTGMLKITPAHDQLDFEIGQRHNLPFLDILNPDGTLNELAGSDFSGMDRFEARSAVIEKLRKQGDLIEEKTHENNVGFSERADVPIEPRLSEQWFLKYPRVEEAKQAVRDGHIKFFPKRWEKTYLHWLENIRDWCISRQLWWGHRIPVWYRKGLAKSDPANWHVAAIPPEDIENWEQDDDVLDTWASSWLWPLATLGWPEEEPMKDKGLDYFYPTSALVTGPDIIFFWVARMIMAGLEFKGEEKKNDEVLENNEIAERIPFNDVYFTGIIRDEEGRKMSKSLGNSPDPLELITKYGADGLRHGIMSIAPKGQDIRFSEVRIEQGRNFCNKLWNVSRFRQMSGGKADNTDLGNIIGRIEIDYVSKDDHAILLRLAETLDEAERLYAEYEFNSVLHAIYHFFWTDFCDWYIEVSKPRLSDEQTKQTCLAVQDICIRQILLLLHPYTPFITEELWLLLGYSTQRSIQGFSAGTGLQIHQQISERGIYLEQKSLEEVRMTRETTTQIRALKAERNLSNNRNVEFFFSSDENQEETIRENESSILAMVGAAALKKADSAPSGLPASITPLGTFFLDLSSGVDLVSERKRLSKEAQALEGIIKGINAKLSNPAFVDKAPEKVVEGAKKQLSDNQTKLQETQSALEALN